MNAYELADDLEKSNGLQYITKVGLVSLSAKMLRQQADRIAELEKCLFQMQNACVYLTKPSAEPFIWLKQDFDGEWIEVHPNKGIPLYTTPQIKELSDEEIEQIAVKWYVGTRILPIGFARAILKKASEK
jgi:hypothetical protein